MKEQLKNEKNVSNFAVYIDEKLGKFDKLTRMYIGKKDILFDWEMRMLTQNTTSHSNIRGKNMLGLAAPSNTFQYLFMNMLNANDLNSCKTM